MIPLTSCFSQYHFALFLHRNVLISFASYVIAFCCIGLSDFLNATVSEESSAYILKDSLASIFDSNSDFWTRAPWVKKEDIRRVFQHMLSEDSKQLDGDEVGTTLNLALHRTERTVSFKSSFANLNAVELRQEKPMFMNTEPLMQMHVDRPEQTGSSARFVYYDSEITSIIRYAHCSGKFQNYTLDIVKRELFPVSSNAAILDEVAPVNVGFEWETIGELLSHDSALFFLMQGQVLLGWALHTPILCRRKRAKNLRGYC